MKTKLSLKIRAMGILSLVFFISSCASLPKIRPEVDAMVISNNYAKALQILQDNPDAYGKNNELLYLLDKGFIEHLNEDYAKSIETFAKAQLKFSELYTESVGKIALTWVINDYAAPYHGEDFEHVFINIFQALNYLMLDNYEDAIVEARDVDSKLNAINDQYDKDQKNVYKEDAFIRMFMGICFEAQGTREDLNDAFISYVKAAKIYSEDYTYNYELSIPDILKENILTTAEFMGSRELKKYKAEYPDSRLISLKDKKNKGEVYLIQYNGISPIKIEDSLSIPMLDGSIVKVAFPRYYKRPYASSSSRLLARNMQGEVFQSNSQLGEGIGAIAVKNLECRKIRFIAKSVIRATGRYLMEKKQKENIGKKSGNLASSWFQFFANIYNLVVEKADLRCWGSLPDQIRIARIMLEPGNYDFSVENFSETGAIQRLLKLKTTTVKKGQKLFLLVHTAQ